jgi:hypothetical protein
MLRRFALLSAVVGIITLVLAQPALAAIFQNTIDPDVHLGYQGRQLLVSGPIACDAGELLFLELTVTQSATGATGSGRALLHCTGDLQQWEVHVQAHRRQAFDAGPAEACAHGITLLRGQVTDEREWCAANGVTLTPAE